MRVIGSVVLGSVVLAPAIGLGDEALDSANAGGWLGVSSQRNVSLTLLPQDEGDNSPACLDGSPYGFYFVPSATGSTKWTIYIQGGGWCFNEEECFDRSQTFLGSSESWARSAPSESCQCMNALEDGSVDSDCNCIYMPYCDGASFSGFRRRPWHVPSNWSQMVYFRGSRNFDATVDFAFENGLDTATEFVLTGQSAGGLSVFLHADQMAERMHKEAPGCELVRAAPIDGYFLDHKAATGEDVYPDEIKYVFDMQRLKAGGDLLPACLQQNRGHRQRCFMSPHMEEFIQTPLFMFNSRYDAWQLEKILNANWTLEENAGIVIQYGEDFLDQFKPVQSDPKNGAFITSCICHGCPWQQLMLDNKTSLQHYADWYYGKTSGSAAVHIDTRHPNGDGTIDLQDCSPFPYPSSVAV